MVIHRIVHESVAFVVKENQSGSVGIGKALLDTCDVTILVDVLPILDVKIMYDATLKFLKTSLAWKLRDTLHLSLIQFSFS